MKPFLGVFRYEYRMSIRRWSLWLAFGLLMIPYLTSMFTPPDMVGQVPTEQNMLSFVGTFAFMLNIFMPVVGGILAADRLVRDQKLGVDELLRSTATRGWAYLGGKYCGALCSILTPVLLFQLFTAVSGAAGGVHLSIFPSMLLAFVGITLPAYAFVIAFSLACPLIMPVRVYQVLFVGYWFWGNFLSPKVMPTLNGTYLTPNGSYALDGFFGGYFISGGGPEIMGLYTRLDAVINLSLIAGIAALALLAGYQILAWRAQHA